jgi:hypothetical protein
MLDPALLVSLIHELESPLNKETSAVNNLRQFHTELEHSNRSRHVHHEPGQHMSGRELL